MIPRLILGAAVLVALVIDPGPLALIALLFVVVVPFEKLFPRHRQRLRRPGLGTDLCYALLQPLTGGVAVAVGAAIGLASLAWLPGLALRPLVALLPPVGAALLGAALFDLVLYWVHRWSHEVPFLWRFHAVHHSPRQLDWVAGFRNHPLDGTAGAPAIVLLLAAGFSPEMTGGLAVVQIITGLFLHANVRWRWRALHRIVITPEFHHWHHSSETGARDTNYSVFLPLWDILFGTYSMPADRRPQRYGIDEPMPDGVWAQLGQPLRGLPRPGWVLAHPVLALRRLRAALARGLGQVRACTHRRRPLVAY